MLPRSREICCRFWLVGHATLGRRFATSWTEATAWIVVGVMAMLAAGGYGFWRYKVAQRMIRWRRDTDRLPLPAASGGRALPPATVRALPAPPGWTPGSAFAAETPPHSPDTASASETAPLLSRINL
ncbi:uncharacterized protein LOC124616679 [Schistocerca americana]|uniref:uncharacterized protein LOC124616679 n=1 Tax=Schistocerca americana TaxID=7009 RepID=UPI001F4FDD29|nr:uncharacterized protein LOC124616679 [Schistocerca americana]